jgi:hypothetical protein
MQRIAHDQAWLRRAAVIGGLLMIVVSFPQLQWTYEQFIGFPVWTAYLVPLAIDGLAVMFAGIIGTLGHTAPLRDRLYAWAGLGFFVAVSIAGNVMHAWWFRTGTFLPPAWEVPALVIFAAIIPIAGALGIHGRSFLDRSGVDADQGVREPARTAPAAAREPARVAVREPARVQQPVGAHPPGVDAHTRARALFELDPRRPATGAGGIYDDISGLPGCPHPGTVRRWVQGWRAEMDAAPEATHPEPARNVA